MLSTKCIFKKEIIIFIILALYKFFLLYKNGIFLHSDLN